ncbi:site-specific integrase [Candidatus Woesearchaeota archaeon]|nr:site-specific integrase [Candidatus Woesearchaeota archaeon]
MPIHNYPARAESEEYLLFSDRSISDKNKNAVKRFLEAYNVSPARKTIFLGKIRKPLTLLKDIEKDMHERGKINQAFKSLRDSLSPSYYDTISNVTNRLVRWLNNGEKPKGFTDIKGVPNRYLVRKLNPSDMITWEDGEMLIAMEKSIQMKAVIATQLDGGFRPSEFIDLCYGDIEFKTEFIIASIRAGKTGPRPVPVWRCVPYLSRWLEHHPSKRRDDPLWVHERSQDGAVIPLKYDTIRQRIRRLGTSANFKKPLDFYNLRHSACTISKMDNVPEEIAAAKFGHSIDHYSNTYGRLNTEDTLNRLRKHFRLNEETPAIEINQKCRRCSFINIPKSERCEKCGSPLSLAKALQFEEENKNLKTEVENLKGTLIKIQQDMPKIMADLLRENIENLKEATRVKAILHFEN